MARFKNVLVAVLLIAGVGLLANTAWSVFDSASTSSDERGFSQGITCDAPGQGDAQSTIIIQDGQDTTDYADVDADSGGTSYTGGPLSLHLDQEIGPALDSADLVEKVGPAVVSIATESVAHDMYFQPVPRQGAGTGVIVSPDGYIVTNHHVVENAEKVMVTLSDGRTFEATAVIMDAPTDLALVHIEAEDLPFLHLLENSLDQLRELDPVVAVGNALALPGGPTWTAGVISNRGRSIELQNGRVLDDLLQTDAAINPGNSGGPLVNDAGQIVGINVAIAANAENIGFAISTDTVIPVITGLAARGQVERPWLGIQMLTVTPSLAYQKSLPVNKGVFIAEVIEGSPAHKAGLRSGDVITAIDDKAIDTAEELRMAIGGHQAGDIVKIGCYRENLHRTVAVTLGEAPSCLY